MQKETKLYGLRAILEAIEADKSIDKIFLQKGLKGELFGKLENKIRKKGLNFSYVPVEKLNRLTPSNHQGAVAQMSPISFYDLDTLVDVTKGCAIVMGSEGKGMSSSILKIVDAKAKLPMFGNIASLNVSVACGVVLYEAVRQRQSSDL